MEYTPTQQLRKAELEQGLIDMAKEYAIEMHGNQRHGCLTISDHLHAVVAKAIQNINRAFPSDGVNRMEIIQAAWLHDVLEDTTATAQDIVERFGTGVADIVEAVTDSPGSTRLERHLHTYYRTRQSPSAVFVKMCDRWHNQRRSLANKEVRFCTDYAKEYTYFKFALYDPPRFAPFWYQLDQQHEAALKFLSNRHDYEPAAKYMVACL